MTGIAADNMHALLHDAFMGHFIFIKTNQALSYCWHLIVLKFDTATFLCLELVPRGQHKINPFRYYGHNYVIWFTKSP